MKTFDVIIAGGRDFNDFELLVTKVNNILSAIPEGTLISIISGTANGADKLGEKYAHHSNMNIISMPAQWDKYGKSAGYKRNEEMAKIADACVCFWDGKSKGTKHMIDLAKKYNLKTRVVLY